MRRQTHLAVGALCAVPFANDLAPAAAAGALVCGIAGAVVPDYLDIRSEFQGMLRHRGISHSIIVGFVATWVMFLIVDALAGVDFGTYDLPESLVQPMWMAFGIGLASHLALDACTPAGIRPALPIANRKLWLLPRALRIRTGSAVDSFIGRAAGVAVMVLGLARVAGVV
jgi:membrane-bound metal-dependent hydrolase YbcI (DUF457 family)